MASQNQRYRGEAKGQAEEKTHISSEVGKEKSGGLMQRTGEQVKNMAQGAADKVKQSFGMAGSGEEEEEEEVVMVVGANNAAAAAAAAAATAASTTTARRDK